MAKAPAAAAMPSPLVPSRPATGPRPKDKAEDEAAGERPSDPSAHLSKLEAQLRGLADKVAKDGTGGNLTVGKLVVKNGRVEIRVQLASLSDEIVQKLKQLGFKELARAKSVKLLIGTIDVKQLEALAKLSEVRGVTASL